MIACWGTCSLCEAAERDSRTCIFGASSDSDHESGSCRSVSSVTSPSASKRRVTFNASPLSSASAPAGTHRRRPRTTSRSIDERIAFRGRNTLYTAGRPAWYDASGEIKEAFMIGICGGSASGKTTVAQSIVEKLNIPWVTLLSMDSFYKVETFVVGRRMKRAGCC